RSFWLILAKHTETDSKRGLLTTFLCPGIAKLFLKESLSKIIKAVSKEDRKLYFKFSNSCSLKFPSSNIPWLRNLGIDDLYDEIPEIAKDRCLNANSS